MRRTVIASSISLVAVAGLAGGVAYGSDSNASPGATPTTAVPGMEIFTDMGLTAEQGECLVNNVGSVDMNDTAAMMDLMTQCGISMDQLLQIGQSTDSSEPATPGEIDPATVAAVLELMVLDQAMVDCLVAEAETAAPADDAAAEAVFVTCGVGPLQILEGIVALDAAAGAGAALSTTTVVGTATTTAGAPTTAPGTTVSSGNAMVDILLEQLAAQGINLDATQGQCLLDNISNFDPNDMSSVLTVMETCGIDITELATG